MDEYSRPQHMIAVVAENGVDAISPAFDQRFGVRRLTLLSPQVLLPRARDLAAIVRNAGKSCEVDGLISAWRPQALQSQLQALLQRRHDEPWLINLSGANPVVAALLYQLASANGLPVFVIEPETDKAVWLIRPVAEISRSETVEIADQIGLRQYFASCGYELLHANATLKQRNFRNERTAKFLADIALHHPRTLQHLNRAGAELDPQLRSFVHFDADDLRTLDFLVELGFLRWHHHDRVQFVSGEARNFLCGGWLELFVFASVAELAQQLPIQDTAMGLTVRSRQQAASEFDIALMANNHLYLIECKSRAPRRSNGVGMEALFKLGSLADQQGLNSRAMLVTLAPPTAAEAQRAKSQQIALVAGKELGKLGEHLHDWISGRQAEVI